MIDNVNILVYRLALSILKKKKKKRRRRRRRERERINPKQCMYLSHAHMTLVGTWGIG